ncbi:MAG TPA: hypothetical protein VK932_03165 [Kofleriaceae bacterium]|nr:hypothetical protein [Kofleriaceae bacterium]
MPSPTRQVPYGAIAAALYALSLLLPAIVVVQKPLLWGAPRDELMVGIQCLAIGWVTAPWYANVALGIASIALACRRNGVAAASSLIALGLALSTFAYLGPDLRAVHVGYFVWLASMVLVFVGSCAGPRTLHPYAPPPDTIGPEAHP